MDEVYSFYKKYYSSNIMTAVVLSKETLPRLEFIVKQEFNKL
jgi:secreted Zn-dependent insulinase-like peptidase